MSRSWVKSGIPRCTAVATIQQSPDSSRRPSFLPASITRAQTWASSKSNGITRKRWMNRSRPLRAFFPQRRVEQHRAHDGCSSSANLRRTIRSFRTCRRSSSGSSSTGHNFLNSSRSDTGDTPCAIASSLSGRDFQNDISAPVERASVPFASTTRDSTSRIRSLPPSTIARPMTLAVRIQASGNCARCSTRKRQRHFVPSASQSRPVRLPWPLSSSRRPVTVRRDPARS